MLFAGAANQTTNQYVSQPANQPTMILCKLQSHSEPFSMFPGLLLIIIVVNKSSFLDFKLLKWTHWWSKIKTNLWRKSRSPVIGLSVLLFWWITVIIAKKWLTLDYVLQCFTIFLVINLCTFTYNSSRLYFLYNNGFIKLFSSWTKYNPESTAATAGPVICAKLNRK